MGFFVKKSKFCGKWENGGKQHNVFTNSFSGMLKLRIVENVKTEKIDFNM